MKTHRLLVALTFLNFVMLTFSLVRPGGSAEAQSVAPVLRGRGLEIVDTRGQVRASIMIYPADPNVQMPDGTKGYPETVLLRLINSKGRPNIKIDASDTGAGVMVGGESNPTYGSLSARGSAISLKLVDSHGKEQVSRP